MTKLLELFDILGSTSPGQEGLCTSGYLLSWSELTPIHRSKAVANGAVSYYIDHYVDTRIVKSTYGNSCSYIYNPQDPEHLKRVSQVYESPSKKQYIRGAFDVIVPKVSLG